MNTVAPIIAFLAPTPPTPVLPPASPGTTVDPIPRAGPPSPQGRWVEHAALWAVHRPWLALLIPVGLVVYVVIRNLAVAGRHRHHSRRARLVAIAAPPQVDPSGAAMLWANLSGVLTPSHWRRLVYGVPHVVFQYAWTGRHLQISIWVPGSVPAGTVEAAIRAAWPGATTTTMPATDPIPAEMDVAAGGHLLPAAPQWLPLRTDHDTDPLRALIAAGSQLKPGEYACVQILARPATARRAARARRAAARLRAGHTRTSWAWRRHP